jgi:hypothetical protein
MTIIGFWHCFGVHAGEDRDAILKRKQQEIEVNGWTLWSFQGRTDSTLKLWFECINKMDAQSVLVFCSDSRGANDPKGHPAIATEYRCVDDSSWQPIPEGVMVPHPFGGRSVAVAFRVVKVLHPVPDQFQNNQMEWFCVKDGSWRTDRVPTRGEYLIRSGDGASLRRTYAILELAAPYVVQIRKT